MDNNFVGGYCVPHVKGLGLGVVAPPNNFFSERKNHVLVILKKNQRSSIHSPLKRVTYHQHPKSTSGGKGITAKMCDPIIKLSHHKERTVFTSTSIECQKALISNLKVITLSIITNIREM